MPVAVVHLTLFSCLLGVWFSYAFEVLVMFHRKVLHCGDLSRVLVFVPFHGCFAVSLMALRPLVPGPERADELSCGAVPLCSGLARPIFALG